MKNASIAGGLLLVLAFGGGPCSMDNLIRVKPDAQDHAHGPDLMPFDSQPSRQQTLRAAVVLEGGLVLVAVAAGWLLNQPPLAAIDWTARGFGLGLAATVPMLLGLLLITRFPVGPLAELDDVARRMVVPLFRECTLVDLLVISALAGLGEEMLFRGVAQGYFERASGSEWLAIVAAGVLFGLAHPITPTYALLAAAIGVYLGWLLAASGNLLVPIVAHGAYDFAALVYLLGGRRPAAPDTLADETQPGD